MHLSALFRRVLLPLGLLAFSPVAALAHPGHDGEHGGGLTWDFAGDVLHRLTSPYHLAPAVIVGAIALGIWWLARAKGGATAKQNVRVSS